MTAGEANVNLCPGAAASAGAAPLLLVSAAALVDRDGRVLLAQRPPGKHLAGLWEFPGGKLEAGETPEAALVRELREELGIDTQESCLAPVAFASHGYEQFHLLLMLFACRKWTGTPTGAGMSVQWVRPRDMFALPMPPADRPLIGLLDALI